MKKIFIFLFMAVFTATLSAQEEEELSMSIVDSPYRIYLGPKIGVNFASMNGLSDQFALNPQSSLGFQGGLAAGIHFGRRTPKAEGGTGRWGIQVEAMYAQRTIKTDVEDLKLSYFEVPILVQYFIIPELNIEVGPTIAGTLSSSPDNMNSGNVMIATGDLKGFDVMITAGIGYKHKCGFTASARYNYGTSKLAGNFDGKISTISVSVGWLFNLVK